MIGIIDYGMGNLQSVKNSLEYLGEDCLICHQPDDIDDVDKIILPGVGAFPDCMRNLQLSGFEKALHLHVEDRKKPILGICLGMQVMASVGTEMELTPGLGWFKGSVRKIETGSRNIKIPNVGWEDLEFSEDSILLSSFRPNNPEFYFVHSYFMQCDNPEDVKSWYNLGEAKVTASVQRGHIFGTQFHPEKSSDSGREVLINFIDY